MQQTVEPQSARDLVLIGSFCSANFAAVNQSEELSMRIKDRYIRACIFNLKLLE